jgi:hypothetical protein
MKFAKALQEVDQMDWRGSNIKTETGSQSLLFL